MKISLPFSSSSSTSSSSSANTCSCDKRLSNSQDVTSRSFCKIIQRFLCTGKLRTHPFDSSKEANGVEFNDQKDLKLEEKKVQAPATPGIVARLMGLETMPESSLSSRGNPVSIRRSRSVSSMDCLVVSDQTHGLHRRVKTSSSFREVPAVLELENDEFLLLSFENVGEAKETGSKQRRKSETGSGESKQRKQSGSGNRGEQRVRAVQKKDDQQRISRRNCPMDKQQRKADRKPCRKFTDGREIKDSDSIPPSPKNGASRTKVQPKTPTKHNDVSDGSKLTKKKPNSPPALKQVEPKCELENSSPVSVLDIDDFEFEQESLSSDDESRSKCSISRKLTPDVVNSSCVPHSSHTPRISTANGGHANEPTKIKVGTHTPDYMELWGQMCKLAEEDMKTWNCTPRQMLDTEEWEEIGAEFGLEIFDQLLHEIASELASEFTAVSFRL